MSHKTFNSEIFNQNNLNQISHKTFNREIFNQSNQLQWNNSTPSNQSIKIAVQTSASSDRISVLFIYPWEEGITKDNLLAIRYPSSPLPPSSGHLSQTLSAERVPPRPECEEYIRLFEYIGHKCSFGHSIISIFSFMKIFRHSSVLSLFDRIYSNIRS